MRAISGKPHQLVFPFSRSFLLLTWLSKQHVTCLFPLQNVKPAAQGPSPPLSLLLLVTATRIFSLRRNLIQGTFKIPGFTSCIAYEVSCPRREQQRDTWHFWVKPSRAVDRTRPRFTEAGCLCRLVEPCIGYGMSVVCKVPGLTSLTYKNP